MSGTESERPMAASISSAISRAVVALLGEYTGRGPTKARTYITEDLILVVLYDTLTSEERAIVRNGGADLVLSARQASQKAMRPDLIATVERFSGRSTSACMSHDHLDPDAAASRAQSPGDITCPREPFVDGRSDLSTRPQDCLSRD